MKTRSGINAAVLALDKERRDAVRELMRHFDQHRYHPEMKALREACGKLGHNWRCSHRGPLNDTWFFCTVCHTSECRRDEVID